METKITECPHCHTNNFRNVVDQNNQLVLTSLGFQSLQSLQNRNLSIGGPGAVFYLKTCSNCGFTGLFSQVITDRENKDVFQ